MMKIAVVEDDPLLHQSLCIALKKEGFHCLSAFTVKEGLALLKENPDLLLLDINLPDGEGFQIAQNRGGIPVMYLTARDAEVDMIQAFDQGCEDYIVKPFSMAVLLKRIQVILRRYQVGKEQLVTGELVIDYLKKQVTIKGEVVALTAKEYNLLQYLSKNKGQTLSKEAILAAVWDIDGQFVGENTVSVTINRLKKKIESNSNEGYIKNIFGLGYIFGDRQ